MLKERRHDVVRIQVEPGRYDLSRTQPFANEELPVKITNLIVAPPANWKPTGQPGKLALFVRGYHVFSAPIEILRVEWQHYQAGKAGNPNQVFHSVVVPVKGDGYILNYSEETLIVDLFVSYYIYV